MALIDGHFSVQDAVLSPAQVGPPFSLPVLLATDAMFVPTLRAMTLDQKDFRIRAMLKTHIGLTSF